MRILFIGGLGRSGSTLLDLMLGQLPGFCAVGELSYLWGRSDEDLCGCGRAFGGCPFWLRVGEEAFGGWQHVDREAVAQLRLSVDRTRRIASLIRRRPGRGSGPEARYISTLQALYRGIAVASDASVIVDSTKHLSTALLLRRVPGVEVRVVHLVRDSRGVAYSWTKRVPKSWVASGDAYMDRFPPWRTAGRWLGYNTGFGILGRLGTPVMRLRYEDLVRDPATELSRAATFAGSTAARFPFLSGRQVGLSEVHTIGGNPVRFGSNNLELTQDDAWRGELPRSQQLLVGALTAPLLAVYGYLRRQPAGPR